MFELVFGVEDFMLKATCCHFASCGIALAVDMDDKTHGG